jgi:CTP:molybdopterin cytidylyltransferase MocA
MGSPKALLDADGPTFLDRVVKSLLQGGCEAVVAVVREDPGPVAAAARQAGARVVVNPEPDHPDRGGPVSSVRTALRELPADAGGAVLLPVDHPLVAPETVVSLLAAHRNATPPAAVPTLSGRRGHPVVVDRALFDELGEEGLDEGVRTVLRRHEEAVVEVAVSDRGILKDVDTLADYRRAFPRAYRQRFHSR